MAVTRIAACVLLTRGADEEFEVFLVERAPELRFFGGYWAFPGGVVDEADHDGDPDAEAALLRCGLRELFEEVGVLPRELALELGDPGRGELRAALLDRGNRSASRRFRELVDRHPGVLETPEVIGRLTTPPFVPVLYRTLFLTVACAAGEEPHVLPGELVKGSFVRPVEIMQRWSRGELLIVPPAVDFLQRLCGRPTREGLRLISEECRAREAGKLHEIRNSPGIWMIPLATETIPPATTTNAYWVGNESCYLVDPASEDVREQERLFEFLDERLAEGACFTGILVSHHHRDHVGAVRVTAARYGVPILGHPLTLERLPAGEGELVAIEDGERLSLGSRPRGPSRRAGEDGEADQASAAAWHLEIHHTPGHDRGHLVFIDDGFRTALVGDLCSTLSTIIIDPPEGHLATYLDSLQRMLQVPMGMLCPAHGPAQREGHALIREYLRHRAEREEQLVGALGRVARSPEELLGCVYTDIGPELLPLAARSLLAGLQKLEEEGRVARSGAGWTSR